MSHRYDGTLISIQNRLDTYFIDNDPGGLPTNTQVGLPREFGAPLAQRRSKKL